MAVLASSLHMHGQERKKENTGSDRCAPIRGIEQVISTCTPHTGADESGYLRCAVIGCGSNRAVLKLPRG